MIDEDQRRLRDYMLQIDPKDIRSKMKMLGKRTFVVNTNHPFMAALQKIDASDPKLAQDMVKQAYDLALLSQREMDPEALNDFIARSNSVMEQIAAFVNKA